MKEHMQYEQLYRAARKVEGATDGLDRVHRCSWNNWSSGGMAMGGKGSQKPRRPRVSMAAT